MSRRQSVLFSVLMALGLSLVISFVITVATMGFPPDFLSWWLRGLVAGFLAAVPTTLVLAPIARRAAGAVFKERPRSRPRTLSDPHGPILFFDGVCGLCSRLVDFSLRRDRNGNGVVRFAPLQGSTAAERLTPDDVADLDTVVFADDGVLVRRSSAIVGLLRQLGGPWRFVAALLWLIPRPVRDAGYRIVAHSRYRIFGRQDTCRVPTPGERARFLD